ncbi:nagb/rpia/CoA transferase-like protein [Meredithblackwellia eburnea MCA 4105]
MTTRPLLHGFETIEQCSSALAHHILNVQQQALAEGDSFTVAMSGCDLPSLVALAIIDLPGIQWDKWDVWLADERVVPLNDDESNFLTNTRDLFSKVGVKVHSLDPELAQKGDTESCALDYEARLRNKFPQDEFARFDLILLGMGPDSPKPPPKRVTITYPILSNARSLVFEAWQVTTETLKVVLEDPGCELPATKVVAKNGTPVRWFTRDDVVQAINYPETKFP